MIPAANRVKISLLTITFLLFGLQSYSQTKKIKRPNSRVGISSVDRFVQESFDIYDKVYMYDGYAAAGKPLDDSDIDVLEYALDDLVGLSESAPNIISDLDGVGVLKQSKATLQINRAKRALKYSIKTVKELLAGERKRKDDETDTETDAPSTPNPDDKRVYDPDDKNNNDPKANTDTGPKTLVVYTNYDFVAGTNMFLYEDFSVDQIGDFPAKWNTNGSGEVVTLNDSPEKWLKLSNNAIYIPDLPNTLPDNFTMEFDMITTGLNKKTASTARLGVHFVSNNQLSNNGGYGEMSLPMAQYIDAGIWVANHFKTMRSVRNHIKKDIRQDIVKRAHIAIAVNKQRMRVWVNERKCVDLPRFFEQGTTKYIKFKLKGMPSETAQQFVFLTNLKLAEGGEDVRGKLLKEGKFSTTGILFDSGSDQIKPESYGTIKKIAEALQAEGSMQIKIVGHTDSEGSDTFNMQLSNDRAAAVKVALASQFNIAADRLSTDGQGESAPVADNTSTEGKAQNRRVEFIKQ